MNNISEKLHELDNSLSSDIFKVDDIVVISSPNLSKENIINFKVLSSYDGEIYNDMCRISMTEPKYIGEEGETLELSNDQISSMIRLFNSPCLWMDDGETYWDYLIDSMNSIYESEDPKKILPLDLPMPDYTKLMK